MRIVPIIALVLFLLGCSKGAVVTYVYDGDTIKIGGESIRLIGVDTPENEWKEKGVKAQCYGKEATDFMKKMVLGKRVRLESDDKTSKQDKYGRTLAYVYVDGKLVNAEIIKQGYGVAYTYFPFTKLEEFKHYHDKARESKRGMWDACDVTCQWKFCEVKFKQNISP